MSATDLIPFKIVSPQGIVYESEIDKVTIPTQAGQITVLPRHAPLVSVLRPGELIVHKEGTIYGLAVSGGILEIRPTGEMIILADTAERAEDIDVERAESARKRAEELLKQQENVADVDFARLQAAIEKELARVSVAKKYRKLP
jgi:F-type H+-transporting ATPase subunit epsilon